MKKTILFLAAIFLFSNVAVHAQVKIGANPTQIIPNALLQINGTATAVEDYDANTFIFYGNYTETNKDKKIERGARLGVGTTIPHCTIDAVSESPDGTSIGIRNFSKENDYMGHEWFLSSIGTKSNKIAGSFMFWDASAWDAGSQGPGANRLLIDPYGRIGLGGVYYPEANLELRNSNPAVDNTSIALTNYHRWELRSEGPTSAKKGSFMIWDSTYSRYGFVIDADGYAAIGTNATSTDTRLNVAGEIQATAIKGPSDKRFKKNIEPLEDALSKVSKLKGYTYEWRKEEFPEKNFKSGKDIGLIAQEVEKVVPEVVYTATDEMKSKSIDYTKLVPLLIESIKELQKEVEELKSQMPHQKR